MDVDELWKRVLGEIELEVTKAAYISFFKNTRISISSHDNSITVLCPNPGSSHMLQSRYTGLIRARLENRLKTPVSITFRLAALTGQQESEGPLFESRSSFDQTIRSHGLNPHYSFDNFAVSESNQMAFAAAQAVAGKLGSAYNPLFLWGSVGVGKTHLAQALGRQALSKNSSIKIIYCTGEEFTSEIIEAIRGRTAATFKRKYRTAKIMIVDDIQFIAGKESVQMEFFHTFNSIVQAGGQVVLTSDQPPNDIDKLEARLRSRFEGGLIVDIGRPNFELRTAILLIKARERNIDISPLIAQQLAAHFEDIRSLEGSLLRFFTEYEQEPDQQKVLNKIVQKPTTSDVGTKKSTDPQKVIEIVASHYNLRVRQLTGISRKRSIAEPRQLIMYLLRHELGLTTNKIGGLLGGRDHTTIIHGVEKISLMIPKNEILRKDLTTFRRLLWG